MRRLAALGVALVVMASSCSFLGVGDGGHYTVTAYFTRAVSLYESSEVKVLGLAAGRVADVEAEAARVKVVMEIDDDVPVPGDARAVIVPQSLIGERHVQLAPVWKRGRPRLHDGDVIPVGRTVVPVEPDEALQALKDFLDALDPDGVGRLVTNAADALEGNGRDLNAALKGVSDLVATLASKHDALARITENFDRFTATLVTREDQIGRVLDAFAQTTAALAEERRSIEQLVGGLAQVSTDGYDLVSAHAAALQRDVDAVSRLLRSVEANLSGVRQLLDSGGPFVAGLDKAYNAEYHRIDLRDSFSPLVSDALDSLEKLPVPVPSVCVPLDTECPPPPGGVEARATGGARIVDLDGAGGRERSFAERVGDSVGTAGRVLGSAARTLRGVFG